MQDDNHTALLIFTKVIIKNHSTRNLYQVLNINNSWRLIGLENGAYDVVSNILLFNKLPGDSSVKLGLAQLYC